MLDLKSLSACVTTQNKHNLLHMILNGKGEYDWMASLVSLIRHSCSCFKVVLFCMFCCYCITELSSGGEKEDYIKCVVGGSLRHLNTFSNFFYFYCWLSTTHINTHYVLLLLVTVPMYTMLSKISERIIP